MGGLGLNAFVCNFSSPTVGIVQPAIPTSLGTVRWCGMNHTGAWLIWNGPSPSTYTGPSAGQSGSIGDTYALLEASLNYTIPSRITSLLLDLPYGAHLLFYLHRYGSFVGQGTFRAARCSGSTCYTFVFTTTNQQPNSTAPWTRVIVDLPPGTTSVYWETIRGASFNSDSAIDSISLIPSLTPQPTSAPTSSQPTPSPATFGPTLTPVTNAPVPAPTVLAPTNNQQPIRNPNHVEPDNGRTDEPSTGHTTGAAADSAADSAALRGHCCGSEREQLRRARARGVRGHSSGCCPHSGASVAVRP
eukprot:m.12787 g.12787  ORF g.12787 m.12787 type:complete len:302 (-) comp4585_c0_seq1:274-1179(-)